MKLASHMLDFFALNTANTIVGEEDLFVHSNAVCLMPDTEARYAADATSISSGLGHMPYRYTRETQSDVQGVIQAREQCGDMEGAIQMHAPSIQHEQPEVLDERIHKKLQRLYTAILDAIAYAEQLQEYKQEDEDALGYHKWSVALRKQEIIGLGNTYKSAKVLERAGQLLMRMPKRLFADYDKYEALELLRMTLRQTLERFSHEAPEHAPYSVQECDPLNSRYRNDIFNLATATGYGNIPTYNFTVYIAINEEDNSFVGLCVLRNTSQTNVVDHIAVQEELRSQQWGTKLLEGSLYQYMQLPLSSDSLICSVPRDNPKAIDFFKQHNFFATGFPHERHFMRNRNVECAPTDLYTDQRAYRRFEADQQVAAWMADLNRMLEEHCN